MLYQDEKFMIFSVDSAIQNSKLNLTTASALPVLIEPFKLNLGDEFSYNFCDEISKLCATFCVLPGTQTIIIDSKLQESKFYF